MALLGKLHRRIVDVGLVPKIVASLPVISIICALFSVGWFALLPMEGHYRRTYISENALMPSQAYSYFRETEWNILRGYRGELEELMDVSIPVRNELVSTWLEEFGMKTAVYHDTQHGDTLYGLLHAPRGDGTEAILLTVPWKNADGEDNVGGAALGIALARYFSRWPIWSRNIILVFSENSNSALRSWVDAYHRSLDLTGGSIEAAIVLDYPGSNDYFDYVELFYDGLNGELPNLDMVNIAVSIVEHEGMKVSLHGLEGPELYENSFFSRLKVLLMGVKSSALSGLRKQHGNEAFSGWRIQCVTLKAHGKDGSHDITTFGRIPEAMFRSINNLLEKFHQSFFFYMLLAPKYFVSISSYLPSAVAISLSFTVASIDSFMNNEYKSLPFSTIYNSKAFVAWAITVAVSFAIAQLFLHFPAANLLIAASLLTSLSPFMPCVGYRISRTLSFRLKSIAFIVFGLVLTCLLTVNFALAFGMGLLAYPLTLIRVSQNGQQYKTLRIKNTLLLIISNPFISMLIITALFEPDLEGIQILYELASAWSDLSCWTWFVICIGWLPTWILGALSTSNKPDLLSVDGEKKEQ